jgi:hypothetical protein
MTCFDFPITTTSRAQAGGSINIEVTGLGFAEPVCIGGGTPIRFSGCTFNAGFRVTHGGLSRVQLWASTFYHEARFDPWQWEPVVDCHFVRCRVSARNNDGWLKFIGCTFEGPIDTAVVVNPVDSDAIWFEGCAFRDCGVAISARKYSRDGVRIIGCRFDRIRDVGILDDAPSYPEWYEGPRTTRLDVVGCEFADCGTAVRWGQPNGSPALVESTTIVRSSGTPIELHGGWKVSNTTLLDAAGDGVYLGGKGGLLENSVVRGVTGAGLRIHLDEEGAWAWAEQNTIVGNGGHGIMLTRGALGADAPVAIRRNLLVLNGGDGLNSSLPCPSVVLNNAWLNYGSAFPVTCEGDSNLTVDPVFCDLAAGDLAVSSVSPCRPDGAHGQIGALGVACTRLADATDTAHDHAWISPNPATDRVSLRTAWALGESEIEVLDLQGRKVWSAQAIAGAPVRWNGQDSSGQKVRTGLYWVRFSQGTAVQTRGLVWIR